MKTSEFIKYFQNEFCYVKEFSDGIFITDIDDLDLFYLDRNKNSFSTIKFGFEMLDFSKQQEYYKVIFEYLMTSPEEREDEKRYYLKLKGFSNEEETYLCAYDFWSDWILIDKDELKHGDEFYFKFTQKEIDEMPECYKHPAVWEQIEVECEEE